MDALGYALAYARLGWSVVPVMADGSKRPACEWKPFQKRIAAGDEIREWYARDAGLGVGVVCGAVSGGLEVMDFDSAAAWERFWGVLAEGERAALAAAPQARTPSGGRHLYFRGRPLVGGNRKLARDRAGKVLIETRGEGGFVVAPGSPPACHPTGGLYEWATPPEGLFP